MGRLTDANTKNLDRVSEAEESKGDVQEQVRLFQNRLQETTADNQALHRQIDMLEKRLNVGTFPSCCVFPVDTSMMCLVFFGHIAILLSAPCHNLVLYTATSTWQLQYSSSCSVLSVSCSFWLLLAACAQHMSGCLVTDTRQIQPSFLLAASYFGPKKHISALISDAAY
jgi:hypothetical protein